MLTYEEVAPALWTVAGKLAKKSKHRFDPKELVSECWLKGRIQRLSDKKFACQRAYFDMIDYMRKEDRQRTRNSITVGEEFHISKEYLTPLEIQDEVRVLLKGLPRKQKKICRLLIEGYSRQEIAEITGHSIQYVWNHMSLIRLRYQARFQAVYGSRQPPQAPTA